MHLTRVKCFVYAMKKEEELVTTYSGYMRHSYLFNSVSILIYQQIDLAIWLKLIYFFYLKNKNFSIIQLQIFLFNYYH